MNENIKAFLQENIELIDNNDWIQVFKNSQDPNNGLSDLDFRECLKILESIGITFTKEQLKNLFIKIMKDEIIQYFQYEPDESEKITWWLNHVPNNIFGYSIEQARDIFINNANQLGIEIHPQNPRLQKSIPDELIMKLTK